MLQKHRSHKSFCSLVLHHAAHCVDSLAPKMCPKEFLHKLQTSMVKEDTFKPSFFYDWNCDMDRSICSQDDRFLK